jgi:hypothetical protein
MSMYVRLQSTACPVLEHKVRIPSSTWSPLHFLGCLQAELQQDIRPGISGAVKLLEHSQWNICWAAINCLSNLGAQSMCSLINLEPFTLLSPPPSQIAARDPASNFWCCEIAGRFQQGCSSGCDQLPVQSWSTKYVFPHPPRALCASEAASEPNCSRRFSQQFLVL